MLQSFYEATLPPSGWYALWTKFDKQHYWYSSIEELVSATRQWEDTPDVYFATASYATSGSRTQANVLAVSSFRVDLDAGAAKFAKQGDKVYETQRDALIGFVEFAKAAHLPPSYIISSGEGLHVYWCLEDAISHEEWTRIAKKLGKLGDQFGLKHDHAVTTDSARILRPIGSLHNNGKRVSVVRDTGKRYTASSFEQQVVSLLEDDEPDLPAAPQRRMGINSDVLRPEGPPKSLARVVKNCAAMADAVASRGDIEEPYWRAMLGIIKHTADGDAAAHEYSSGYDGYDYDETQSKLDRWTAGPTTCTEFSKYSKKCSACPHYGKIKSPIVKGVMTVDEEEALPKPEPVKVEAVEAKRTNPWDNFFPCEGPKRQGQSAGTLYEVVEDNGHYVIRATVEEIVENEDGDKVRRVKKYVVSHTVFWFMAHSVATVSSDTGTIKVAVYHPGQRPHIYDESRATLGSPADVRRYLTGKSVLLATGKKEEALVQEVITALMHNIQNVGRRPQISQRIGLNFDSNGKLVAHHGKFVIHGDGRIEEGLVQKNVQEIARRFNIAPLPESPSLSWPAEVFGDHIIPAAVRHVQFLNRLYDNDDYAPYSLGVMMTLASPMMAYIGDQYHGGPTVPKAGLTVAYYSAMSGYGKTMAMQASMMAYGDFNQTSANGSRAGSTDVARFNILSNYATMPVMFDEIGDQGQHASRAAALAELIKAIANGAGRVRALNNTGITESNPWSLVCCVGSNISLRELIQQAGAATDAVQNRLLEINVESVPKIDFAKVGIATSAEMNEINRDCAGALGAVIHYAMCKLGPYGLSELSRRSDERIRKIFPQAETAARFQWKAFSSALAVRALLKSMGINLFTESRLIEEFKKASASCEQYIKDNNMPADGVGMLGRFLVDMKQYTVVTVGDTVRRGGMGAFDMAQGEIPRVVKCRHIASSNSTLISIPALKEWCRENRVSERTVIGDCLHRRAFIPPNEMAPAKLTQTRDLLRGMKEATGAATQVYLADLSVVFPGLDNSSVPGAAPKSPTHEAPELTQ